jgi:hypothetical protein
MDLIKPNMIPGCLLMLICLIFPARVHTSSPVQDAREDSVRVKELLIIDTVRLNIPGASNDVAFFMNGLVFLSNSKYHQKMIPDHITFGQEQAYFVPLEYISLESSRPLFENDPFPYPPGGMSFTRDYSKVYFTKPIELSGRRTVEKIYEMSIVGSRASAYNQLPFCSDPARYMHPAISTDGSMMVFASDRMPSSGGLDLFMVKKQGNEWSAPVNLGRTVNTSGHEWYPFLDHHNNLYFSSSGHMGYGGYDIYLCPFNGSGWDEPMNMTEFINTEKDELAFSIHPNNRLAVFSTSFGSDPSAAQVYKISLNPGAVLLTGIEDAGNDDLSVLFPDMVESGYTPALLAAGERMAATPAAEEMAQEIQQPAAEEEESVEAVETEEEPELPAVEPGVEKPQPEVTTKPEETTEPEELAETEEAPESEIAREAVTEEPEIPVAEETPEPDRVIFRVQILSSMQPHSKPSVTIGGTQYETFEYLYKGAYRITVGAFSSVQDALDLRARCRAAGYSQAFVAAFRNNERELDPSVFRQ